MQVKTKKVRVAKTSDLANGEMKKVKAGRSEILLRRIDDRFYAGVAKCPHHGAPLDEGAMSNDRIVCPWHHAAFDAKTGEVLEPPALDSLTQFEVSVDGDDIVVELPAEIKGTTPHRIAVKAADDYSAKTFVILGAGAAGNTAAETLRQLGFQGKLKMITMEDKTPYDRTELTKTFLSGETKASQSKLRNKEFYRKREIELIEGRRAKGIDTDAKRIAFENGEDMAYDKLLVAVGGKPRKPDIPGANLNNVFTIRKLNDAIALIEATEKAKRVVIVGAGFIGLEAASSLRKRGLDVTLIAPETIPLEKTVGTRVGAWIQSKHEMEGTRFLLPDSITKIEGKDRVTKVLTANGETIETDLVLFGVGVDPATAELQGLEFTRDGGIEVDERFHAGNQVYAAGDIACFPYWRNQHKVRIEHWRTAQQQGKIAAYNMLGRKRVYRGVPFFWSMQADTQLAYVGQASDWDDVIINGQVETGKFMAYYIKNNRIQAALAVGRDEDAAAVEELMRLESMPEISELRSRKVDLRETLAKATSHS